MSKLIITSTNNGTIRYIEGDEVEVSIDGVKERVSAIEAELAKDETSFTAKIEEIKKSKEERIAQRKNRLEVEIQAANQRCNSDIEAIEKEIEARIQRETTAYEQDKVHREALEKEKVKLTAVLQSAPVLQSQPVTEAKIEADTSANTIVTKQASQPRRIIF